MNWRTHSGSSSAGFRLTDKRLRFAGGVLGGLSLAILVVSFGREARPYMSKVYGGCNAAQRIEEEVKRAKEEERDHSLHSRRTLGSQWKTLNRRLAKPVKAS